MNKKITILVSTALVISLAGNAYLLFTQNKKQAELTAQVVALEQKSELTKIDTVHVIVNTILADIPVEKIELDTDKSDLRKSVIASILVGDSPQELPSELYDSLTKAISLDLISNTDGFNSAITGNELFELIITANQLANIDNLDTQLAEQAKINADAEEKALKAEEQKALEIAQEKALQAEQAEQARVAKEKADQQAQAQKPVAPKPEYVAPQPEPPPVVKPPAIEGDFNGNGIPDINESCVTGEEQRKQIEEGRKTHSGSKGDFN